MKQKVPKCKGINPSFMNNMFQFPVFGQYIFKKAKSSQVWTQSRFGDASFIYNGSRCIFHYSEHMYLCHKTGRTNYLSYHNLCLHCDAICSLDGPSYNGTLSGNCIVLMRICTGSLDQRCYGSYDQHVYGS